MAAAKFCIGDKVRHAANADGKFPESCGYVITITPWNSGDGYSYQLVCAKTFKPLGVNFKAEELSLEL